MPTESIDTLLTVLRRSELLAPEQVDEVARELGPVYAEAAELGEYLVSIDWLTAFQLQTLLEGRWREVSLGPFQLLDRLGEGGLSEVFKAWDTARGKEVALKVLRPDLNKTDSAVRQFEREFESSHRLSHPNIIRTFDAGESRGRHYFSMEFVEGMDLEKYVAQVGPLAVETACDFIRQAAHGLQHAHQEGLVHRDIKPANLFLLHPPALTVAPPGRKAPDPVVKIIDWGLAQGEVPGERSESMADDGAAEKGTIIGTADYMAPEQISDPTLADTRADIYSLGCTLYFLLTTSPPFPVPSLMQKILMHKEAPPPSVREVRADVPEELDAILQKMLAKKPEDRYPIPLGVVTPLRRYCPGLGAATAAILPSAARSGMVTIVQHAAPSPVPNTGAPSTAINLERPGTRPDARRPGEKAR